MLGLLGKDDDPRALTAQPGLDQLAELVGVMAQAGLICARHAVETGYGAAGRSSFGA